jgi:hypothetical protein
MTPTMHFAGQPECKQVSIEMKPAVTMKRQDLLLRTGR